MSIVLPCNLKEMLTSRVVGLALALLLLVLSSFSAPAAAESLRNAITVKVTAKSALYDSVEQYNALNPDNPFGDVATFFNNSNGNFTQPLDEWKRLPQWLQITVGLIVMLVGLLITFFGVRYLAVSIFLMGGFLAALIMWAILAASIPNSNPDKTAIVYSTAGASWLLFGCIFACFVNLAVFVLGFTVGAILSLALNPVALKFVWPEEPIANMLIFFFVFGFVGGCIACFLKKPVMILGTSAGGAFLTVASIMAMAGTLNIVADSGSNVAVTTTWQDYLGFAGMCCLCACGVVIQLCVTSRKGDFDGYIKLD